jgi:hypothetical protein
LPISVAPEALAIYVVDLKTKQVSTLPGSDGLFSPRYSPDGRFLVAIPGKDQTKLMLFDFQTQKWSEWTKAVGQIGFISWSKDGKYLYFDTLMTSAPFFGRVKVGQTQFEPVVDLKGIRRFLGVRLPNGTASTSTALPYSSATSAHKRSTLSTQYGLS